MNFIFAVLAFAVAANAQKAPEYQQIDNECTRLESVGSLSQIVGKTWVDYSNAKLNCTTITVTKENGYYTALYGPVSDEIRAKFGHAATFVEDPNGLGHFEIYIDGKLTSTATMIAFTEGLGYKSVSCNAEKDAKITIKAVGGFIGVTPQQLDNVTNARNNVAPNIQLYPVRHNCN